MKKQTVVVLTLQLAADVMKPEGCVELIQTVFEKEDWKSGSNFVKAIGFTLFHRSLVFGCHALVVTHISGIEMFLPKLH